MKKKTNLTACLISIMVMLFSLPANAQEAVGYAQWDESSRTLTFKGGASVPDGAYELTGTNLPRWSEKRSSCTKVVFDESFKDVRPTSCYEWFFWFSNLTTIEGIEYLNTANVADMREMFKACRSLTSLDLSSFNTANVTSMSGMFDGCSGLTSLDLSSFNTANVWGMTYMFKDCSGLTSLDLSSFNTANVTDVSNMFDGCYGLTSLDLSSFNTAKVTWMNGMFSGCSGLTSLDLSSFNTANVMNMNRMFTACRGLTSLDLSSFNTANVGDMDYMFQDCSVLTTIYVSDDFTTGKVYPGKYMFEDCYELKGAVAFDSHKTNHSMANYKTGYFTKSNLTPYVKWNGDTKVLTFKVANYIAGTNGEYQLNEGANSPGWWKDEVRNNCTKVVFTSSFKQAKPTSCYKWFDTFLNLTTIQGIEYLNTEEVTIMGDMFTGCRALTSLDLSSFNTANVTDMRNMFCGCLDLTSLDLSSFNTAKVTDMDYMFYSSGLTAIYVSDEFTTGNVTDGSNMFTFCYKLKGAASYDSKKIDHSMANYKTGYFKTYFKLGNSKVELCGEPLKAESLDLSGDYDFTPKHEFTAQSATYNRDLSSSKSTWFSLCLPFAYIPENFTAYQLQGATEDAVEIEQITGEIAAGTPVLFKFNDGNDKMISISATDAQIMTVPVDGTTASGTDGSSLQLCGTYQNKSFSLEDNNAFILMNDKLMNPAKMLENSNVTKVGVKPFRGYMTLTASAESPAQQARARAFSIGHGEEGGTTAIDLLNSVATDDAEYYDINGRRINAPAKGVNVVRRGNKTMKLIVK